MDPYPSFEAAENSTQACCSKLKLLNPGVQANEASNIRETPTPSPRSARIDWGCSYRHEVVLELAESKVTPVIFDRAEGQKRPGGHAAREALPHRSVCYGCTAERLVAKVARAETNFKHRSSGLYWDALCCVGACGKPDACSIQRSAEGFYMFGHGNRSPVGHFGMGYQPACLRRQMAAE